MPGIDAHLGAELSALRGLDIECEHHSTVAVLLVRSDKRGLPQAVAGGLGVRRQRRRRQVRFGQQPSRGKLHPYVRGGEAIEAGGPDADEFIPRLSDFGLAKLVEETLLNAIREAATKAKELNDSEMQRISSAFQVPGMF